MSHSILSRIRIAIALLALVVPGLAAADDGPSPPAPPAPTPAQLEQAKKAYSDGKKLHEAGKRAEAIEKFKESYRLSRNALLLYNVGFLLDEAKDEAMALFYYRKFLKDAPATDSRRAVAAERIKVLEKSEKPGPGTTGGNGGGGEHGASEPAPPATEPPTAPAKKADPPAKIKPAGTYGAKDFQHIVVETAPPGKPLDVTASVPEDSGFVVTLYFRTAGEGKFTAKEMRWRYKELVARVPAPKMIGNAVQYYIEVKDSAGTAVTRNAKPTSPNLINLEAGAPAKFYADFTDDSDRDRPAAVAAADPNAKVRDEAEDPLSGSSAGKKQVAQAPAPSEPIPPSDTPKRGGSSLTYAKWGTTGGAATMLVLSLVFYVQATKYATALEDDSKSCGLPPCLEFDSYGADVQSTGQRYSLLTHVALVTGIATAGVAGYLWYRDVTKKRAEHTAKRSSSASWAVAPVLGDSFAGATAGVRF